MPGQSLAVLITDSNGGAAIDSGARSVDDVIRGDWTMSVQGAADLDYLVAIRHDRVYQLRRIAGVDTSYTRTSEGGRTLTVVRFSVQAAPELEHLLGQPVPAGRMRNPVKYLTTARLLTGDVAAETTPQGRRAVIGGFTLVVGTDGDAEVTAPLGATVSVRSIAAGTG